MPLSRRLVPALLAPLVVLGLNAAVAAQPATGAPSTQHVATPATPAKVVTLRPPLRRVLKRVNIARQNHGVRPLRLGACLTTKVAQPWSAHLADIESLVHRDMSDVWDMCPGFNSVGENIAYGYPTAASVMQGWMHSPGHRRNILSRKFSKIGLGLAYSDNGTPYWVQNFGG